jgi:hypothetical protein
MYSVLTARIPSKKEKGVMEGVQIASCSAVVLVKRFLFSCLEVVRCLQAAHCRFSELLSL